jgi:hypothetical protein
MNLKEDGSRIIGNSIWSVGNGKLGVCTRTISLSKIVLYFQTYNGCWIKGKSK